VPKKAEKTCGNDMDFSPTAQFAKNVRTVVKCTECDKPKVLYACQKISDEQYQLLQAFIDSVKYSCGVTSKNISDLSSLSKEQINNNSDEVDESEEVYGESSKIIRKRKTLPLDNEEIDEDDGRDRDNESNGHDRDDENADCNEKEIIGHDVDSIVELFQLVQINTKHTCRSKIEKSYFKARIFLQVCCLYGTLEDIIQVDDQLPYCQQCHLLPGEKRLMGNKRNNNPGSRKKRKI